VRDADVICTATTSRSPVFDDTDVKAGTHINAVGAFTPLMREVPSETLRRARIVVDSVTAALEEGGDLTVPLQEGVITQDDFQTELGMLVGNRAPGRQSAAEITFFKSFGNAVQDVVVARRAVDQALERGAGTQISLD
jgi:ornithine cyclodeaminase